MKHTTEQVNDVKEWLCGSRQMSSTLILLRTYIVTGKEFTNNEHAIEYVLNLIEEETS